MTKNRFPRMNNVGIVVEDLKGAIAFFEELGLKLEGEMTVEGKWVDRVVGLEGVRNDIATMATPDGQGRLELMKFRQPTATTADLKAPVNTFGIRRIMFAVSDLDEVAGRLGKLGAERIGDVVQFGDLNQLSYRLCYLHGPEGIIIALAEQIDNRPAKDVNASKKSTLLRMDNVLIVVDDVEATKAFFVALGMEHEGDTTVEGQAVDRLIGLKDVRATLGLLRTPDGNGRIELDKYHTPPAIRIESADAPVNTVGIRRIMFAVDDIDEVIPRLRTHGAELIGEVVEYKDTYRLCYIRGPEGLLVGLAQEVRKTQATNDQRNA